VYIEIYVHALYTASEKIHNSQFYKLLIIKKEEKEERGQQAKHFLEF